MTIEYSGSELGATPMASPASATSANAKGEAQRRWELMNLIRQEKFDLVLPVVMRENNVDMWITVNREGFEDPLTDDFGRGYVGDYGYYIFTDRGGERIERTILGVGTALVEDNGAYDIIGDSDDLRSFVEARDPRTIALNYSRNFGAADGLSHTTHQKLTEELGAVVIVATFALNRLNNEGRDIVPVAADRFLDLFLGLVLLLDHLVQVVFQRKSDRRVRDAGPIELGKIIRLHRVGVGQ